MPRPRPAAAPKLAPAMPLPIGHLRAAIYAYTLATTVPRASRDGAALVAWLVEYGPVLGIRVAGSAGEHWDWRARRTPQAAIWRDITIGLRRVIDGHAPVTNRIRVLARGLGLDPAEAAILQLVLDYACHPPCERLWDMLCEVRNGPPSLSADPGLFAVLTGRDPVEMNRRLMPDAALYASGVLSLGPNRNLMLLERLRRASLMVRPPEPRAALLGPSQPATLPIEAFRHLGDDVERTRALLRGAIAERAPGVHVLLYGPPGTGKTALAGALAASLGVPLYAVGETDARGGEPSRGDRLAEYQLAQRLLIKAEPALLLFDEAEDLFAQPDPFSRSSPDMSRAFIHRQLEEGRTPVIWTANNLGAFPAPVLRRMSCCLEIRVPPEPVRARLWTEVAEQEGVVLPGGETARLARAMPTAPALARSALRAARLAGGAAETVRWALAGVARAMAGGVLPPAAEDAAFDPRLMTADRDLAALAERLAAPGATRRVSLLLSGPPGSGKSLFARHLAQRMGLPVLQRRASDLLGAFVGETEKAIAAAFAEARADGAFLVFDEADSLLGDRRDAARSWEVSQVNEMLTWMESHPLPFCCTTNLAERLDPATARRFLVKARFGWLSAAQAAIAFREAFGQEPPRGLDALTCLTPADFALVRRQAEVGEVAHEPAALLSALEREQRAKPGAAAPVGFRLGA